MPLYQNVLAGDQPVVKLRRSTTFALSVSFADWVSDATDIENVSAVLAVSTTARIIAKVAGNYHFNFCAGWPAGGTTSVQFFKNNTTVIPGGEFNFTHGGGDNGVSECSVIVALAANDYVSCQVKASVGTPNIAAGATFTAVYLAGQKGDQGAASATDASAVHVNVGNEISLITEKASPVAADLLIIEDSAAAGVKKRLQIGNLPTGTTLSDTAPSNVTYETADKGVGAAASRYDHKHNISAAAPAALAVNNSQSLGAATSLALSDHQHAVPRGTPVAVGTANAAGASGDFADAAHVHAGLSRDAGDWAGFTAKTPLETADLFLVEDSGAAGAKKKTTLADLLATTTPSAVGTAAVGSGVRAAKEDHIHGHGNLAGGSFHADVVSGGTSGFMTGADKAILDAKVYGNGYTSAASAGRSTYNTNTSFQVKVSLTTGVLVNAATYEVQWTYVLDSSTTVNNVEAKLYNATDAADVGGLEIFRSANSSVRHTVTAFETITGSGATKTLELQYRTTNTGTTVGIASARVSIKRVA